jgi:hypothetical protein
MMTNTNTEAAFFHPLNATVREVTHLLPGLARKAKLTGLDHPVTIPAKNEWFADSIKLVADMADTMSPTVQFNVDGRSKRINISGAWPKNPVDGRFVPPSAAIPYNAKAHTISVAGNTTAEGIARAIVSRFLPKYLEQHKACQAYCEREANYRDSSSEIAARLAGRPIQAQGWTSDSGSREFSIREDFQPARGCLLPALGDASGTVKVTGTSVAISLSGLTEAQAARVLAALGEES